MGRKPNQIILEYFDRGQKLDDASNRYQYDCKACGEHFPKGRVDTLKLHVTQKCLLLSPEDRQWALRQMEENLRCLPGRFSAEGSAHVRAAKQTSTQSRTGTGQKLSGLEALAEASRRVGSPPGNGDSRREDDDTIDPSLRTVHVCEASLDIATQLQRQLSMSIVFFERSGTIC